jgi:hypothetical protein
MEASSAGRISLIENNRTIGRAPDGIFFGKSSPGREENGAVQAVG